MFQSLTQTSLLGAHQKKKKTCRCSLVSQCLRSSLSFPKRTNTTKRVFCSFFPLPSSFNSLHHLSWWQAAFYIINLLFFYTSRPPFHPTKSVSCSPLRRADLIFKADSGADGTGRMKSTDPETESFLSEKKKTTTINPLQQNERLSRMLHDLQA